ncbi:MAG TPA: S1/P1 Nuclease [Solibacterales bacterium]|nr:S1/P1 Nuclease [Bryobacterales bacterium]
MRILSCFVCVTSLFAWGPEGHQTVSRLAEKRLNPKARAMVSEILGPSQTLVTVAVWADEVRRDRRESGPWHYINIPIDAKRGTTAAFCPPEGCVVRKVTELVAALKGGSLAGGEREEALKYLVHFVQDMHQPLHCGDRRDRGGNDVKVKYFGRDTNLHAVWDSGILFQLKQDSETLAARLDAATGAGDRKAWAKGSVEDWAWEAQKESRKVAYGRLPKGATELGDEYQKRTVRTVERQLAKGGVRLAAILNEIWK